MPPPLRDGSLRRAPSGVKWRAPLLHLEVRVVRVDGGTRGRGPRRRSRGDGTDRSVDRPGDRGPVASRSERWVDQPEAASSLEAKCSISAAKSSGTSKN